MWRSSCSMIIGFVVGLGYLSAVASGGVSLVSQQRSIHVVASSESDDPGKVESATGFGRFHQSIHADFLDREALEGAAADATQDSTITTSLLRTFFDLSAGKQDAIAAADSSYAVIFDVTTLTPYHLQAQLTSRNFTGQAVNAGISLHQSGPAGPIVFDRPLQGDSNYNTFTETASGILAPGRYSF
jgi:hypothetical protein